jgi:hypothetical protein
VNRRPNIPLVFQRLIPGLPIAGGAGCPGSARYRLDRLDGNVALFAKGDRGLKVCGIGWVIRAEPVPGHEHGIEVEALEAAPMHCRHRPAVSRHADKSDQPLLACLQHRFQRPAGRERLLPLIRMGERVELQKVDVVGAKPLE